VGEEGKSPSSIAPKKGERRYTPDAREKKPKRVQSEGSGKKKGHAAKSAARIANQKAGFPRKGNGYSPAFRSKKKKELKEREGGTEGEPWEGTAENG